MPLIYLTAFSDSETVERARQTLPAAYLTKPYQARNLLITIDLALHNFAFRKQEPGKVISLPGARSSPARSEEHTSELQSLMRISYAVFCLKKKKKRQHTHTHTPQQTGHRTT